MELFRVCSTRHGTDLVGTGARLHGGRWNHKGHPVVYTSMSRSLASLEFLVHVPWGLAPADLSLITISVPDDASVRTIESHHLPAGWAQSPPPGQVADVGTDWLTKGESLLLRVPTALVMAEWNVLINPRHREIAQVRILAIEPFEYDPRLLGER